MLKYNVRACVKGGSWFIVGIYDTLKEALEAFEYQNTLDNENGFKNICNQIITNNGTVIREFCGEEY